MAMQSICLALVLSRLPAVRPVLVAIRRQARKSRFRQARPSSLLQARAWKAQWNSLNFHFDTWPLNFLAVLLFYGNFPRFGIIVWYDKLVPLLKKWIREKNFNSIKSYKISMLKSEIWQHHKSHCFEEVRWQKNSWPIARDYAFRGMMIISVFGNALPAKQSKTGFWSGMLHDSELISVSIVLANQCYHIEPQNQPLDKRILRFNQCVSNFVYCQKRIFSRPPNEKILKV